MKNIFVRRADLSDAADILKITREAFTGYAKKAGAAETSPAGAVIAALDETVFDTERDIKEKFVFIAEVENSADINASGSIKNANSPAPAAAGSVRLQIFKNETGGKTAYLSRFAVCPKYQGGSVGRILMDAVDQFAGEQDIKQITLHTASKIAQTVRFYYSLGFYTESVSAEKGYLRALMRKEYV